MKSTYCFLLLIIAISCSSPASKESSTEADSISDTSDTAAISNKQPIVQSNEQSVDTPKDFPSEDEKGFRDFVERFKNRRDVSAYEKEKYYSSFMTLDYGSPVLLQHLLSTENAQIFRVQWGEMETNLDRIWVYTSDGEFKSSCEVPTQDVDKEIHDFRLDTISIESATFLLKVLYSEYELGETPEGFPMRGEFIQKVQLSMLFVVSDDLQCGFMEREEFPKTGDVLTIQEEIVAAEEGIPELPVPAPCPGMEQLVDREGNLYPTFAFDSTCWTAKNLNVTTYRNGDAIKHAATNDEWRRCAEEQVGCWCYYANDEENGNMYGKLYNYYAITDTRNLAPEGWKVAKSTDIFSSILGDNAGRAMKSMEGWANNGDGDNRSGFNGLPAGIRWNDGTFHHMDSVGYWWGTIYKSWLRAENSDTGRSKDQLFTRYSKRSEGQGLSLRLVRE